MSQLTDVEYAVLDVETTGFAARTFDRIVEIAIIRLGRDGTIKDEFVSLVNPGRDLGPTHIHGLTGREVMEAPRFADIVGDVVDRLGNAVVAGHNIRFDATFVAAECERAGIELPDFPTICTLRLTAALGVPVAGRRLADCCDHHGIDLGEGHSAAGDATACAKLLARYLQLALSQGLATLSQVGCTCGFPPDWPKLARTGKALCRTEAQRLRSRDPHYLARLVTRLMGPGREVEQSADFTGYMELLDRALEDRLVTDEESEALFAFAREYGLTGQQVLATHRSYLRGVAQAALADGVISDAERRDLIDVTRLLGFDKATLDVVLDEARAAPVETKQEGLAGKRVCFTGALTCSIGGAQITREQAHELASKAGLEIAETVTKTLDLLVVADPNSLSGKAQKARKYGTRIMAEIAFWQAIGVAVD